jgi:membrane associated rhomboid family serine protease
MLIPVGLEKNEVRRHPWISYAIIAINVLVFLALWVQTRDSDVPRRATEKIVGAFEYLQEHPYLTVPHELERFLGADGRRQLALVRQEYERRRGTPVEWAVRRQQQKLNEMAADVLATIREFPTTRQGFVPAQPEPVRILTSMFVHGGWFHLIGNLLFFFAAGPFLEDVYGRVLFAVLYLLSGLAALGAHVWQNPGSLGAYIGASGAIAGILGAFLVRFTRTRMSFLWFPLPLFFWWRYRVRIPAFVFLPLWFLNQYWLATTAEGGNVAVWAHVGGFAFGVAFALLMWATGIERRFIHPSIEAQIGWAQNEALVHAMETAQKGDFDEARRETAQVLRDDPTNIDARRYAYATALDARDWKEAGAQATRLLELYTQRGETDLARTLIEESLQEPQLELPTRFLLRAADFLGRNKDVALALDLYRRAAETHPEEPAAFRALFQSIDLYRQTGQIEEARRALSRARSQQGLSPEWSALLEQKRIAIEEAASGYRGGRLTRTRS